MNFHRWSSTDDMDTDACMGCGVASHVIHESIAVVDYSPLPLMCPGPGVVNTHHFIMVGPVGDAGAYLDCHYCGAVITDDTDPATVEWECVSR